MCDKNVTSTDELIKKVFYNHFYTKSYLEDLILEVEYLRGFIDTSKKLKDKESIGLDSFFDSIDKYYVEHILEKLNKALDFSNDNTEDILLLSMQANRIWGVWFE